LTWQVLVIHIIYDLPFEVQGFQRRCLGMLHRP
jgi:hypothetical protein